MSDKIVLGAVAYDPKVITIWEGFADFFAREGLDFDYILYSNYEAQVRGHFAGHCNVAWNSPLAWIEIQRLARQSGRVARAVAMRDSDRDLTTVVVAHRNAGIDTLADLRGKRLAVGAIDSPQATLIPIEMIAASGVMPGVDFQVVHFNVAVGKHGDHVGGERDAARAVMLGDADAACMLDANRLLFAREGIMPTASTKIVAETDPFDHCNFSVLDDAPAPLIDRFVEILLAMRFDDPAVRSLLELEGLRQWLPGRVSGYAALNLAVDRAGGIGAFLRD